MIKSISYSQSEILKNIISLYLPGEKTFDCDPCYGSGNFYLRIQKPKYCFDISPALPAVQKADCRNLPLKDQSIKSIIFDPPFLCGGGSGSIMKDKYGFVDSPGKVWELYRAGIAECSRVLKRYGILVVKCQDFLHGRNQYMTHYEVLNVAIEIGLYPKDLFILLARTRPKAWNHQKQNHSRKFHSYFYVFGKQNRSIDYSPVREKSRSRGRYPEK